MAPAQMFYALVGVIWVETQEEKYTGTWLSGAMLGKWLGNEFDDSDS